MKKSIRFIAACVGTLLLAAGIALPSASADPTNNPSPGPPPSPGLQAPRPGNIQPTPGDLYINPLCQLPPC